MILLLCTGKVSAQKKNAVKLNYLSPFVRTLNMSYERIINDRSSAQLGLYYTAFTFGTLAYSGCGITPEYRYYFSHAAGNHFYVAPFARYQKLDFTAGSGTTGFTSTLQTFGGGMVVGRQYLIENTITLDFFIGPAFNSGKVKYDAADYHASSSPDNSILGIGVRCGTTIGIAF